MTVKAAETKGLVDMSGRVLGEILKTPRFKAILTVILNSIDPQSAPSLVQKLFWQDPAIFLSMIGFIPQLVNTLIELLNEVGEQFDSLPEPLLIDVMNQFLMPLDGVKLGAACRNMASLAGTLTSEEAETLRESASALAADVQGGFRDKADGEEQGDTAAAMERWIAAITEQAKDEDSNVAGMIEALKAAIDKNPDFREHVLRPLLG